jgi:tetratricopeptide (TPR) repeat protein
MVNATKAIDIDPKRVKAYYLRGIAHANKKNFDEGIADIKEAIKLMPNDANLRKEFEKIKE